jgi:hypothetical protein
MRKTVDWVKSNKLTFVLLLVVGYFIYTNFFRVRPLGQLMVQEDSSVSMRSLGHLLVLVMPKLA